MNDPKQNALTVTDPIFQGNKAKIEFSSDLIFLLMAQQLTATVK